VNRLAEAAERTGRSLLEVCHDPASAGLKAGASAKVAAFASLMDHLGEDTDLPVQDVIENVVLRSGLEQLHRWAEEADGDAWANIAELISTAAEFDSAYEAVVVEEDELPPPAARLVDYLQQVSLVSDADHFEGSGAVTLMTLHAAKGLEFPVVYVIGCEQGLLPFERGDEPASQWSSKGREQLEEERRLAFVGMTRAKEDLTLSCVRQRMVRGRHTPQAVSPFLKEIGTEHVRTVDLTTVEAPRPGRRTEPVGRGGYYEDVDGRAVIEAMAGRSMAAPTADYDEAEPPPPEYEHLKVGCLVQHAKFGVGKVVKLSQPWPKTRAVIDFQSVGRKTLVLKMANLELA
jgi:DNA helicase-2/ATP-dependent DNA helicase PcrA